MPKKVVFYEADFLEFERPMLALGFRRIKEREFKTELYLANVEAPSKRTGREEGFTYFALGLRVIVWTTYVVSEGQTRENDEGRVLILESNKPVYFGTYLHRTKFFFERMYLYALAAKEHIDARPACPECKRRLMSIMQRKKNSRQCFWKCTNPIHGKKPPCYSWNLGLSEKTQKFLKPKWDRAASYYAKLRAAGKEPGAQREKRHGWKKKPEKTP
jgi:hypothetical protein